MATTIKLPKKIRKSDLEAARDRLFELRRVQNESREEEVVIREWIANTLHTDPEGAKTLNVEGIKLTVTRPLTRTITAEDAERFSQDYPDLSAEVLRWKPEVKVAAYKANAALVDPYITTKPGLPTVEFK